MCPYLQFAGIVVDHESVLAILEDALAHRIPCRPSNSVILDLISFSPFIIKNPYDQLTVVHNVRL